MDQILYASEEIDVGLVVMGPSTYLVQGPPEVLDVVQRQARHDVVERTGIGEPLDAYAPEDAAFGRPRIDGGNGVASASKGVG